MEMLKVRCFMSTGFPFTFGRLPGHPKIPAQAGEVEMHPLAEKYLRQDPRVIFCDTQKAAPPATPKQDEKPVGGNSESKQCKTRIKKKAK